MKSDRALLAIARTLAGLGGATVLLIGFFLAKESWPFLSGEGLARVFLDPTWNPTRNRFGLLPMLSASLAVTGGSLLVAAPLGIGSAVLTRFVLPSRASGTFRGMLVLMAGVPSVVYGLWGLDELVPRIAAWHPPGASLLAAVLVLALMILPTIALTAHSALAAVPESELQAAAALGLSATGTVLGVAFPSARAGIAAGAVVALGRALGETMAVLMVCGNVVQIPRSLFTPVRPLTANIALEIAYAMDSHRAALFVSGLLLMSVVAVLAFVGARKSGVAA